MTKEQAEDDLLRMLSACDANLGRYVFDASGQARGRCVRHEQGNHHPLCPIELSTAADVDEGLPAMQPWTEKPL